MEGGLQTNNFKTISANGSSALKIIHSFIKISPSFHSSWSTGWLLFLRALQEKTDRFHLFPRILLRIFSGDFLWLFLILNDQERCLHVQEY